MATPALREPAPARTGAAVFRKWRRDLAEDPRAAREIIIALHRECDDPRAIAAALRGCNWPRGDAP